MHRALPGYVRIPAGMVSLETKGALHASPSKSCTTSSGNGGLKSLQLLECTQHFTSRHLSQMLHNLSHAVPVA